MPLPQEKRLELIRSRRLRRIRISFELWREFVRGNLSSVSTTDCPDDLEVVGLYPADLNWQDVDVVGWSAGFSPIPENETLPLIDPITYSVEYLVVRRDRPDMDDMEGQLDAALMLLEQIGAVEIVRARILGEFSPLARRRALRILEGSFMAAEKAERIALGGGGEGEGETGAGGDECSA